MAKSTDLIVRVDGDVSGFDRAAKSAAASASVFERELAKLEAQQAKVHQSMTQVGQGMAVAGAAMLAGVGLAVKAAVDWESAWAGVRKTVDGSDAEMAALEGELRNLAKTLPATHREIAAVAEAAGQLGVKREAIVDFTRTMVDLGETTNLTADEAATSIAQMANIMGTTAGDVDNLGAALVALGNDGASTERDIIMMAQRIAGAGKTIGLTEADVLGFANALSSMGVEVEAGGTAISRVMLTIDKAVAAGGDGLEAFAQVAGMSAQEFAAAFENRPTEAISAFVEGLGRIEDQGGNTTQVLEDLELGEIRVSDALRRLSSNTDVLNDSLALGSQAWEENRALVEEAAKRYDTTAAKVEIARNNLNDAAITIGDSLLPALASTAEAVADVVGWFDSLPAPVQNAVAPMGLLAGGLLTTAGAALMVIPKIAETRAALDTLATSSPKAAGALAAVGKAAGAAAAIYALVAAVGAVSDAMREAVPGTAQLTSELLEFQETADAAALDEMMGSFGRAGSRVDDLKSAFDRLNDKNVFDSIHDGVAGVVGFDTDADKAAQAFEGMGQALASLVTSGHAADAEEQFNALVEHMGLTGDEVDRLREMMPAYAEALASVENEATLAAEGQSALTDATETATTAAEDAATAVDDLIKALDELNAPARTSIENQIAWQEALTAASEALDKNGQTLDLTSEKGQANMQTLLGMAEAADGLAQSVLAETGSEAEMRKSLEQSRKALYDTAIGFGATEEQAQALVDQILATPPLTEAEIALKNAQATMERIDAIAAKLAALNGTTADVAVRYRETGGGTLVRGVNIASADGNILTFAGGGEYHSAMIAPAGANRLWAEPETGGEAYIPLAQAKRAQSLNITREVASRFGYELQPVGAGAVSAGSRAFRFDVRTERAWTPAEALQLVARAESMYL